MSFDSVTRSEIRFRSGGNCEARLDGCRGQAQHAHHRKLRRHGDHTAINGLDVCFACHAVIHSSQPPIRAQPEVTMHDLGLLVRDWQDPGVVPVKAPRPI